MDNLLVRVRADVNLRKWETIIDLRIWKKNINLRYRCLWGRNLCFWGSDIDLSLAYIYFFFAEFVHFPLILVMDIFTINGLTLKVEIIGETLPIKTSAYFQFSTNIIAIVTEFVYWIYDCCDFGDNVFLTTRYSTCTTEAVGCLSLSTLSPVSQLVYQTCRDTDDNVCVDLHNCRFFYIGVFEQNFILSKKNRNKCLSNCFFDGFL